MYAYEKEVHNYYLEADKKHSRLARFSRNLNWCYVQGKLDPCYHREDVIHTIQKILLRKNKANILLTGSAGCGKTAIVEGLAAVLTEKKLQYTRECLAADKLNKAALARWEKNGMVGEKPTEIVPAKPPLCDAIIYEVSLNSMVSGTKYRGEFEERLADILAECKRNPNIIWFIDEGHHMSKVGATEGSVSIGQILKPALARRDICVISATTAEEKAELLEDKAFARRFTELEVPELQSDAVLDTATQILNNYCAYHNVTTQVQAKHLLSYVRNHLPNTVFPDNYINVVDETLAGAVLDGEDTVKMCHFANTLSRMTGHIILCAEDLSSPQAG